MKIKDITSAIESFAPLACQEDYDNAGLVVGRSECEVDSALICVDVTEEVLDEALRISAGLIISHHPIIFHAVKRLNSSTYIERVVERAIQNGIALYACHTNLDSVKGGMSFRLAELLDIQHPTFLEPDPQMAERGFGIVGELPETVDCEQYLIKVKSTLGIGAIRHNRIVRSQIRRVALCTGAGASLVQYAAAENADLYLCGDMKYNDFLDAEGVITVADIGHFESEYCAIDLIFDVITKKIPTFALHKSKTSHNPVYYLI